MQFPVIIHCTVKGRKSAHGHGKGAKASFPATLQGETLEKALQDASLLFPKEEGYRVEVARATPSEGLESCPAP